MSYILDALKKSDRERKQGDVPNLQTVHIPINTEQQTPWGLYGFISILLLVLAFVIGLVVSGNDPVNSAPLVEKNRQYESVINGQSVAAITPAENVVKVARPDVSTRKMPDVKIETQTIAINSKVKPMRGAAPEFESQQEKVVTVKPVKNYPDSNDIPYLHEMPDYQQQSIPEMNFAGHVYSTSPASRSVIINDYAMSEGDVVVQGINVIEITAGGVVFSLHDEFFRVDILQDWSFD